MVALLVRDRATEDLPKARGKIVTPTPSFQEVGREAKQAGPREGWEEDCHTGNWVTE